MNKYESHIQSELKTWKVRMKKKPSVLDKATKRIQSRWSKLMPEKVHEVITTAIKQVTRTVIFGAKFSTSKPAKFPSMELLEVQVSDRIKFYRNTAAAEGAVTGVGGFLMGFADFPLWLTLKMKMLFEIASLYGFDVSDYKERLYILHVFQLAFSSQQHRNKIFKLMDDWDRKCHMLPQDINQFDWRSFQLEFRDNIDLAKLFQLIPGVGALVGAMVNHKLTGKLGSTAMNAYRMRISYINNK